jgi:hypothetical protein
MSIVGPIAPYSNVPIHAEYYQPRDFTISDITLGRTTTVTTTTDHDYVIGQQVRLLIPTLYRAMQLNRRIGYVISVPSSTQVVLDIDSSLFNTYLPNPITATITAISQATNAVVTAVNYYVPGNNILIEDVAGMTELNGNYYTVVAANATSFTLNVNSSSFTAYTSDGTSTLFTTYKTVPQIIAIGDINSGVPLNSDVNSLTTYISGSFINIS